MVQVHLLRRLLILAISAAMMLLAACTSTDSDASADNEGSSQETESELASGQPAVVDTTTLAPQPPSIEAPASTFAEVGQSVSEAIVVADANNDETVVRVLDNDAVGLLPRTNVRGRIIGFDWQPAAPGEWDVVFTATDLGGLTSETTVRLIAHNEPSVDMVYVMGDSIAAGFGRDRSDFAGSDECFRSEGDSYGSEAFDRLIDSGALGSEAELLVVACAGIGLADLAVTETLATNRDGDVQGEPANQVERATELNPTIITLTAGAADIGLFELDTLIQADADQNPDTAFPPAVRDERVGQARSELSDVLDLLINTTSAHIVVTTMYNPVATNPIGVDGCTGECMVEVTNDIVDEFNQMVVDLVGEQRAGRISLARLDGEDDVWEASNGAGIDALRDGLGPLQGLVDTFTSGSNALCADDGGAENTLISTLDCAHPNEEGQRAIAEVVISELLAI